MFTLDLREGMRRERGHMETYGELEEFVSRFIMEQNMVHKMMETEAFTENDGPWCILGEHMDVTRKMAEKLIETHRKIA